MARTLLGEHFRRDQHFRETERDIEMRNQSIRGATSSCYAGTTSCFTGCVAILYSFVCFSGGSPSSAPTTRVNDDPSSDDRISRSTPLDASHEEIPVPSAPPLAEFKRTPGGVRIETEIAIAESSLGAGFRPEVLPERIAQENISGVQKVTDFIIFIDFPSFPAKFL